MSQGRRKATAEEIARMDPETLWHYEGSRNKLKDQHYEWLRCDGIPVYPVYLTFDGTFIIAKGVTRDSGSNQGMKALLCGGD